MHEYFKYDIKNNLAILYIKLKAGAKQNTIENYYKIDQKHYLKVSVKQPRIEGKANAALIKLLSEIFNIKQSNIDITAGLTNEYKIILLKNVEYDYLKKILANYI
jgi:uncharacterized protein (TIGR00251 family)